MELVERKKRGGRDLGSVIDRLVNSVPPTWELVCMIRENRNTKDCVSRVEQAGRAGDSIAIYDRSEGMEAFCSLAPPDMEGPIGDVCDD